MGRKGFLVAVWLIGTMFATSLAWSAVRVVGDRVTEQPVAATDLVVAGQPSTTAGGSQGTNTTTTVAATALGLAEGGQATFTCVDDNPVLVEASPNLGWERDMRAPDGEVWFDHDGDDSAIRAHCDAGMPVVETDEGDYDEAYEDEHGDDEHGDDEATTTTAAPPPPATTADDSGGDDSGGDDDSGQGRGRGRGGDEDESGDDSSGSGGDSSGSGGDDSDDDSDDDS